MPQVKAKTRPEWFGIYHRNNSVLIYEWLSTWAQHRFNMDGYIEGWTPTEFLSGLLGKPVPVCMAARLARKAAQRT